MKTFYPWHKTIINKVEQQFHMGILPHAMLFRCRYGYFDDNLGWEIARLLLCDDIDNICKHCQLLKDKCHPNVLFLDIVNEKIGIDNIREMEQNMWQTAIFDKPKIAFINGIDFLSIGAQNALLKTLEEPPDNSFFVLSAANISQVLLTIISRVQRLHHSKFGQDELFDWLQNSLTTKSIKKTLIRKIAKLADNAPKPTLDLLSSPNEVAYIEREKKLFASFLVKKATVKELLSDFNNENAADVILRFFRYTESMIKFLFTKKSQLSEKSLRNSLQYEKWSNISLEELYKLYDILTLHKHLLRTNVNMSMQLATSLLDWQNGKK